VRPPAPAVLALAAAAIAAAPAGAAGAAGATGAVGSQVTLRRAAITILVLVPGARVVVTRNPYRLQIKQGDGADALFEVSGRAPRRLVLPAIEDPIGTGLDNPATPTLYAPLSFLVGSETLQQYPGGLFGGNLMRGTRSGVIYRAQRVLHVTRWRGGVRLVISTTDPSGRRLLVTVRPIASRAVASGAIASRAVASRAISVSVTARPARGVVEVGDSFRSGPDEGFFGFGGRHNSVDQRGQVLSSFVSEENLDNLNHDPGLSPNGDTAAYYPEAEFFSSRPYGFELAQSQLARFKLDAGGARAWNVTASAPSLAYVVAPGPAPRAMRTLTALSGRQPVPPIWALGPMLDRLVKNAGETTADYEATLTADLANIARYRLPLTGYRVEGWGFPGARNGIALHTFTTPGFQSRLFATLHRRGIRPLVYLRPWITPGSAPVRKSLVVRTAGGAPYYTATTTGKKIALLDFTDPAAVRFWRHQVARALNLGADGFMQDFGEEVLFDMHFHDGETGVTMHNRYSVLYARATRAEFTRYARAHPGRGLFFFTRAGYSGLPGSAAYESANFPGDETTDFSHASGLASLTSDMLGRAVDGAYGFGTDIGGYYDLTTPPTTKELFLRWAEWAALSPIFRLHGSGLAGTHTPWSFGPEVVRVYASLSRLHLRAAPLIMRLWRQADRTGMPVTRPLWLADPGDPRARRQDQEWLLGPDLLVAPVVAQGATSRQVFFPPAAGVRCTIEACGDPGWRGSWPPCPSCPTSPAAAPIRCDCPPGAGPSAATPPRGDRACPRTPPA